MARSKMSSKSSENAWVSSMPSPLLPSSSPSLRHPRTQILAPQRHMHYPPHLSLSLSLFCAKHLHGTSFYSFPTTCLWVLASWQAHPPVRRGWHGSPNCSPFPSLRARTHAPWDPQPEVQNRTSTRGQAFGGLTADAGPWQILFPWLPCGRARDRPDSPIP